MSDQVEKHHPHAADEAPKNDFVKLLNHIKDHPGGYVAGVVVVLAAAAGGALYKVNAETQDRLHATILVRALELQDRALQVAALGAIAEGGGPLAPEALYLQGEMAFRIPDLDTAEIAFDRLVADYPEFQFAPAALEGLGYVEEDRGDYEAAALRYLDVQFKYPDAYVARRQYFNLGRVYAAQGKIKEAVDSYRRQVGEFADSVVAARAGRELAGYRLTHPKLFEIFEQQFQSTDEIGRGIEMMVLPKGADQALTVEEAIEFTERQGSEGVLQTFDAEALEAMREEKAAEAQEE